MTEEVQSPSEPQTEAKPWYEGMPEQVRKFSDPVKLAEAYVGLEKLLGVPKEKLRQIPDDEQQRAGLAYELLGVPEPDKWKLPAEDLPKELVESDLYRWFEETAKEVRLPPAVARKLVDGWNEHAAKIREAAEAEKSAQAEKWVGELRLEWGPEFDRRVADARSALASADNLLRTAGYKGEGLAEVLSQAGLDSHPAMVRLFSELRRFFREDTVVGAANSAPAPAVDQIDKLTEEAIKAANAGDRERAIKLASEAARLRAAIAS